MNEHDDKELSERAKKPKPQREPRYKTGWMAKYASLATSADTGAVLRWS